MNDQDLEVEDQRSSTTNSVEFEVGDKVRIVYSGFFHDDLTEGDEGIIRQVYNNAGDVSVEFPNHEGVHDQFAEFRWIEKLEQTNMSGFTEFAVKVNSSEESRLYQEIALKHGFLLHGEYEDQTLFDIFEWGGEYNHLKFEKDGSFKGLVNDPYSRNVLESPSYSDFVDALKGQYDFGPDPIKIGGDTVEFYEDHIEVGCTSVDNETVKEIHDRIQSN